MYLHFHKLISKPCCALKQGIKNKETKWGFQWIDKPAFIKFVSEDITYNIVASEEVTIENKVRCGLRVVQCVVS